MKLLVLLLIGFAIFQAFRAPRSEERRAARLSELQAGASERYFEEHRALKTYPNRTLSPGWKRFEQVSRWAYVLFGFILLGKYVWDWLQTGTAGLF